MVSAAKMWNGLFVMRCLLDDLDLFFCQAVEFVEVMFCLCLVANLTLNTSQVVLIHSDIVQQPLQVVVNPCNNVWVMPPSHIARFPGLDPHRLHSL